MSPVSSSSSRSSGGGGDGGDGGGGGGSSSSSNNNKAFINLNIYRFYKPILLICKARCAHPCR